MTIRSTIKSALRRALNGRAVTAIEEVAEIITKNERLATRLEEEKARALKAERERGEAVECVAIAFAAYCRENPDHYPDAWADAAQDVLGSDRACEIYSRVNGGSTP